MARLAIITTHPIQYYAPLFKLLHERDKLTIRVFYTWGIEGVAKNDPGFGKRVTWDIPLLEGYPYEFQENISAAPGSHHAKGIVNPTLIQHVADWQPDAILVYGWLYHSHRAAMRHFKNKVPVFFRGDSTLLDERPGLRNLLRLAWLKYIYRYVDYALYPGRNSRAYFKKYGLKEGQLIFAPHAVDNGRFGADRRQEAIELRSRFSVGTGEVLILFAGKFEDKKAPVLLLDAFMKLGLAGCHILFVGNGPLENTLKTRAAENPRVHFMGFQNQSAMPAVYQSCDLYCLPSRGPGETWGLAVNEAMACGKAVLVSDKVGCAPDLVRPRQNGMVFRAGDKKSLLNALRLLATSRADLNTFGQASLQIIGEWTFLKTAMTLENLMTS